MNKNMSKLLKADPTLAHVVLDAWFTTKNKITSLEFKNQLREIYPEYEWTQLFSSKFLYESGLQFDDNGVYRTYHTPYSMTLKEAFQIAILELEKNRALITKKNIKGQLSKIGLNQGIDYVASDIRECLVENNFCPTGMRNAENHNIYVQVAPKQHYSTTKNNVVYISSMHKNYLENVLRKNYPVITEKDFLNPDTHVYNLLQAYFTWDLRQEIKEGIYFLEHTEV